MVRISTGYSPELLFDIAPTAMLVLNRQLRIVKVNRAALREFDGGREGVLNKPLTALFPEVERKRLEDFLDTASKLTQRSPHEIFQGQTRNGNPRFLEVTAVSLDNKGLLVIFHNVSKTVWLIGKEEEARLRAEEVALKLARAEHRLQMAIEAGRMGIWEMDLTVNTLSWTLGLHPIGDALHFTNITIAEFLRRIYSKDRAKIANIVRKARKNDTTFVMEYRVKSQRGGYRWVLARGSTGKSSGGQRVLSGVWIDISARKIIESRVRAQYEANKLLARSSNLPKSIDKILHIIGASLSASLGCMWAYDPTSDSYNLHSTWKANPKAKYKLETRGKKMSIKRGKCFVGGCREVTWIPNIKNSDDKVYLRKAWALADGFLSVVAFPVYVGEEVRFVGEYYSTEGFGENREITRMLTLLGHQLGQFIKRVETQEELVSSKAQLEAIFQSVSDGIVVQDARGEIIYANEAAAKLTGFTKPSTLVKAGGNKVLTKFELINEKGERFDPAMLPGRRVLKTKRATSAVVGYKSTANGEEKWALIKASPALNSQGKVFFVVNVFHDITASILDQKSRDLFLGIASHELKTPVAVIKAYAQLAAKRIPKTKFPESADYVRKINDQADSLTTLIGSLLDATRIRAGKFTLSKTKFDLDKLVDETIQNVQLTTTTHRLVKEGRAPFILADPARISQVLINLLRNAIKYSPQADRVIVRLSSVHDSVVIEIADFGIGIAKTHQRNLFEPLYRVSDHKPSTVKGLGLGLYISAAIVTGHGGTISVTSKLGKGSTFTVTLPR